MASVEQLQPWLWAQLFPQPLGGSGAAPREVNYIQHCSCPQWQPPHGQGNSKRLLEGPVGVGVSHWRAPGGRGCDWNPQPLGPGQVSHFGWTPGSPPENQNLRGGSAGTA